MGKCCFGPVYLTNPNHPAHEIFFIKHPGGRHPDRYSNFRPFVDLPPDNTKKMKKLFTVFALLLAIVSCTKSKDDNPAPQPPTKVNVRFYSTNAVTSTKPITAQVNGTNYGTIKYSASQPDCSAAGFGMVQLKPGVYAVDYLDPANPMANKQVSITVPQSATTCVFFDLK
jgi:hypothetical protein